jgi:PAS domain S-box-containing protein
VIDVETGVFEKINPAWQKTLGLDEEELLSTPFLSLLHPDDVIASETAFQAVRRGPTHASLRKPMSDEEGDYHWLSRVAVVVDDKLYSSARDVTDQKIRDDELRKVQETLRQAQKMEVIGSPGCRWRGLWPEQPPTSWPGLRSNRPVMRLSAGIFLADETQPDHTVLHFRGRHPYRRRVLRAGTGDPAGSALA